MTVAAPLTVRGRVAACAHSLTRLEVRSFACSSAPCLELAMGAASINHRRDHIGRIG